MNKLLLSLALLASSSALQAHLAPNLHEGNMYLVQAMQTEEELFVNNIQDALSDPNIEEELKEAIQLFSTDIYTSADSYCSDDLVCREDLFGNANDELAEYINLN